MGDATIYAYDAHGDMTRKTQPDAGTTRYKYDRLHTVRFSQSAQQARGTAGAHRADSDAAAEITARIAYDHEWRVTHRRVAIEGLPDKDIFYSYDLAGKVTAMVYPDGGEVHYAYDAAGRLAGVTDAEENALAAYSYDNDGRMATHSVGHTVGGAVGGAVATGAFGYNVRDWVSRIDYPGRFTLSQAYDAVGNVTSQRYRRAATEGLKTATYAYDGLHRLKTVSLGATRSRSYAYDANGNVTHVATGGDTATYAYSRGSTPNQLDSLTVAGSTDTFVYNANGSATQVAGTAMAYDHRGLLTGYGAHAYTIDAEGYRVKKTGGGSTVYYIRGAGGSVLATYDGAGSLTAAYVYAGGDRLAKVASWVVSYNLKDHLGSTRTLLSSTGTATANYDYWPYGEVLASSGTDSAPFKFTGHERDAESGLDFMQYRTYGSERLRFLQVDPAAEKYPGLSPYVYALNKPLHIIDPDGQIGYNVNRTTGKITRVDDKKGGNKVDYFTVGTSNNDGGFVPDPGDEISVERGGGSIVSFRITETDRSTTSTFVIPGEDVTGFFLEPAGPSTTEANQDRRIPEGAYNLEPFSGATKKDVFRLYNEQVAKERNILIHTGNWPGDTEGCLLPGCTYGPDYVGGPEVDGEFGSTRKFKEISRFLNAKGAENVQVNIFNVTPDEEDR